MLIAMAGGEGGGQPPCKLTLQVHWTRVHYSSLAVCIATAPCEASDSFWCRECKLRGARGAGPPQGL
jgi:hypothetical protein